MGLSRFAEGKKYKIIKADEKKYVNKFFEVALDHDQVSDDVYVNLLLPDRVICCWNEDVAQQWLMFHNYEYEEVK